MMDAKLKPVPAFYGCYLLRSTVRHTNLYVGSTPNPMRRLGQHNGQSKGGAVRTSRLSLRPWEMVCIVAGFPSNIAALQFEWAWHNTHLTKHIAHEDRISQPIASVKINRKTGKTRKKPGRPRTSLIDKLSNLHLLLRAPYFSKWPLELRFFSQDVHKKWTSWCERTDTQVDPCIKILLDLPQKIEDDGEISSAQPSSKQRKADLIGKGGVTGVDPTYARFLSVLCKLKSLDEQGLKRTCDICENRIDAKDLYNICLDQDCDSLSHLSCLSKRFLQQEKSNLLVPNEGSCSSCGASQKWSDLMRVLSLRMRAEREVNKLLRKRNVGAAAVAAELLEEESEEDSGEDADEVDIGDDEEANDSDDAASTASTQPPMQTAPRALLHSAGVRWDPDKLEIVIEDSEDEG